MADYFTEMARRYLGGDLPWDDPLPPPEVRALAQQLPPGRALDLGCGAGRACIALAQRGWLCDGVDFVPQAIAMAQERARRAGVADRARFHVAPVTRLAMLSPPYDLAIDVGCMHALRGDDLRAYAAEVGRLVRPGSTYLLFARLGEADDQAGPRGIAEPTLRALLTQAFAVEQVAYGETRTGDASWVSAWFWMRRAA